LEVVAADVAITEHEAVSEIVKAKKMRSDGKTASLPLTEICVDANLHDPSFVVLSRPYYPVTGLS
jgi:hypothetical protein